MTGLVVLRGLVIKSRHAQLGVTTDLRTRTTRLQSIPEIRLADARGREHHVRDPLLDGLREGYEITLVHDEKAVLRVANATTGRVRDHARLVPMRGGVIVWLFGSCFVALVAFLPVLIVGVSVLDGFGPGDGVFLSLMVGCVGF